MDCRTFFTCEHSKFLLFLTAALLNSKHFFWSQKWIPSPVMSLTTVLEQDDVTIQHSTTQYTLHCYLMCWWYCTEYRPSPRSTVTCLGLAGLTFFPPFFLVVFGGGSFLSSTIHLGQVLGVLRLSYLKSHVGLGQEVRICNVK